MNSFSLNLELNIIFFKKDKIYNVKDKITKLKKIKLIYKKTGSDKVVKCTQKCYIKNS